MALTNRNQPLDERVTALRAELDKVIDERANQIAKECPGVPLGVIRNSITRGMGCQCAAYLEMRDKDEAQRGAA
ncbi:hypothetical protein JOE51_006791 [Bradyrhizobium japonicum]|uniref:hypothetical protein n=1 Tax=Bradyrhizobium diazoefficiens TaxID=1355477 RepID=UPI001B758BC4|nr:hypothetical protein [Bradyrhizobium japonicum]